MYHIETMLKKASIMTLNGNTWEHVGTTIFSSNEVTYPSLLLIIVILFILPIQTKLMGTKQV